MLLMSVEFCHPFTLWYMPEVVDLPLTECSAITGFLFCFIVSHTKPPVQLWIPVQDMDKAVESVRSALDGSDKMTNLWGMPATSY